MPGDVVIWGAAGHAKVAAEILRRTGFRVVGFIDDVNPARRGESFCGATVLGGAAALQSLKDAGVGAAFIAFGHNENRLAKGKEIERLGFELVRAIHPSAIVATDAVLGCGCLLAAGAVVNPSASIGRHAIVNTNATVDHDCVVGDGAHVGPGASIAGHVRIGRAAWVGIGATVIDHVDIGAGSIVGAGAVVVAAVPDNVVASGVPAKVIRSTQPGMAV